MMFSTKLYCFNELKKLLFETPIFFINKLLVTHHRTTQRINCGIYRVGSGRGGRDRLVRVPRRCGWSRILPSRKVLRCKNLPAKIDKNPETAKYFGIYSSG